MPKFFVGYSVTSAFGREIMIVDDLGNLVHAPRNYVAGILHLRQSHF